MSQRKILTSAAYLSRN